MPIITFWSNNEKAIGQTVAVSAAATTMAMERNYKILLISVDYNNDVIEGCFGAEESNKEIVKTLIKSPKVNLESGINGLLKLADSNRITPDVIHDYTKIVFKNRLEVLYSPFFTSEDKEENNKEQDFMEKIKNIIQNASRYYDYVFVDLKKGYKYIAQEEILKMSDVVVLNINQKIKNIENLMRMDEIQKIQHKTIWNICKYDKNSKYNLKNLSRGILKKQIVCQTDYNTLLLDATQEGAVAELLLRFRTLKTDGENKEFFLKIKELIENILSKYQEARLKL